MSDISDEDNEISFSIKFLGVEEVVQPKGIDSLNEAFQSLKAPDRDTTDKAQKKSKVGLFLSTSGIDILENKTKYMMYTCPLSTVSFSAVLPSSPKIFGFVAKDISTDMYRCYLFQSKKFSYVIVSVIGDAFRAMKKEERFVGARDLKVEALRHKNKILQRENAELKRRLAELSTK